MTMNARIRNRRTRSRSSFIFKCDDDLLNDIRYLSEKYRFSIAHFLRESALRNVAAYKRLDQ
jgi:hypothetical protein